MRANNEHRLRGIRVLCLACGRGSGRSAIYIEPREGKSRVNLKSIRCPNPDCNKKELIHVKKEASNFVNKMHEITDENEKA